MKKTKNFLLLIFTITAGLLLDQFTKIWLAASLSQSFPIIDGLIRLRMEKNPGLAFSISLPFPLLITINLFFFGVIIYYLSQSLDFSRKSSQFLLGLLAAGALGNLLDRFRLGYVIDFVAVGNFPVFNVADSFITVAIFLLVLFYDKIKRQT